MVEFKFKSMTEIVYEAVRPGWIELAKEFEIFLARPIFVEGVFVTDVTDVVFPFGFVEIIGATEYGDFSGIGA